MRRIFAARALLLVLLVPLSARTEPRSGTGFGRLVVVTGGTRGIGRELVRGYLGRGDRVATFGRSPGHVGRLRAETPQSERRRLFAANLPVEDPHAVASFLTRVAAWSDRQHIDVLVNNAAITGPPDESEMARVLAVNTVAPIRIMRTVLPAMTQSPRGGVIINMSSGTAAGVPGWLSYGASKAALNAATASLAGELKAGGHVHVSVLAFNPGHVDTQMQATARGRTDPYAAALIDLYHKGELVDPVDTARQIMHVAKYHREFKNGTVVHYADVQAKMNDERRYAQP